MKPFLYARPETLDDALVLLNEYGPAATLLAGGTDFWFGCVPGALRGLSSISSGSALCVPTFRKPTTACALALWLC